MTTSVAPEPLGTSPVVTETRVPTEVSAAWELELLIAGAVTFALFQLPGSLETLRVWALARISGAGMYALIMGYIYTKVILYVLIGAFLLNLTMRAYWVGLVGLHSVYPRGVVWEQMRMGPVTAEEYRRRLASLPSVIARVDNFASIIFSFAFLIVVVCLFSLVGSGLFGAVAWSVNQLFFGGRHGLAAFETLAFGFALPLVVIGLLDKRYGPRWAPGSTAGRRLRSATRFAIRMNGSALYGPIFFTLFTNFKRGVMLTVFYATFLFGMLVALVEFVARMGLLSAGSPRFIPDDEAVRGVATEYYESTRTPDSRSDLPTIQSDVIDGPYVKLFVPYDAERHDPALTRSCPGARPLHPSRVHLVPTDVPRATIERAADSTLACLARMHALTLDGAPHPEVPFRFYTHPVTGRRGMIAYVPTAPLAPGAHVVSVLPPPRPPESRSRKPLLRIDIPFWK